MQDATIVCAYAQLRAADLALGSVWVGAFDEEAVRRAIRALKRWRLVALLLVGHLAESPEPTPRRALQELVSYERMRER